MQYLLTKAEFADLVGVGRSAISNAIKRGQLDGAMVGRRVDLNTHAAIAYCAKHPFPNDVDDEEPCIPGGFGAVLQSIPLARALLARILGEVPSDSDVAGWFLMDVPCDENGTLDASDERFQKLLEAGAVLYLSHDARVVGVTFSDPGKGVIVRPPDPSNHPP